MSDFLEDLKRYFDTTPPDKIKSDWEKSKECDNIGPTCDEFMRRHEQKVTYTRQHKHLPLFKQRRLNRRRRSI
jgi:hypothetical protein